VLRGAVSQPSLPYVSADHQALTGRLYALNLRTGTISRAKNAAARRRIYDAEQPAPHSVTKTPRHIR